MVLCSVSVLIVWFCLSVFHLYVSVLFLLFSVCLSVCLSLLLFNMGRVTWNKMADWSINWLIDWSGATVCPDYATTTMMIIVCQSWSLRHQTDTVILPKTEYHCVFGQYSILLHDLRWPVLFHHSVCSVISSHKHTPAKRVAISYVIMTRRTVTLDWSHGLL